MTMDMDNKYEQLYKMYKTKYLQLKKNLRGGSDKHFDNTTLEVINEIDFFNLKNFKAPTNNIININNVSTTIDIVFLNTVFKVLFDNIEYLKNRELQFIQIDNKKMIKSIFFKKIFDNIKENKSSDENLNYIISFFDANDDLNNNIKIEANIALYTLKYFKFIYIYNSKIHLINKTYLPLFFNNNFFIDLYNNDYLIANDSSDINIYLTLDMFQVIFNTNATITFDSTYFMDNITTTPTITTAHTTATASSTSSAPTAPTTSAAPTAPTTSSIITINNKDELFKKVNNKKLNTFVMKTLETSYDVKILILILILNKKQLKNLTIDNIKTLLDINYEEKIIQFLNFLHLDLTDDIIRYCVVNEPSNFDIFEILEKSPTDYKSLGDSPSDKITKIIIRKLNPSFFHGKTLIQEYQNFQDWKIPQDLLLAKQVRDVLGSNEINKLTQRIEKLESVIYRRSDHTKHYR
jgi:hypothetical protein